MLNSKFFLAVIIFLTGATSNASFVSAATEKLYPVDDWFAQLTDVDGFSNWSEARDYQGLISNDPYNENFGNNIGQISVRSDKGTGFYRIYRVSSVFDFSELPVGAEVVSAKLLVFKTLSNNNGNAQLVVTAHTRASLDKMQKQDWNINNYGEVAFATAPLLDGQYTEFEFNANGLDYLNQHAGSEVVLGLITDYDFLDVDPGTARQSVGWYELENGGDDKDPYLEVRYELNGNQYSLYTQIESPYPSETETADWADDQMPCGTIAACGCAITSAVMLARSYGVTTGVDGTDVNPKNFNNWLKENGGYNKWGELNFLQALKYFAPVDSSSESYFSFDADRLSESETKAELSSRPIITEVLASNRNSDYSFTHFLLSTDFDSGEVSVNDPLWYNTENLDDDRDRDSWVQSYGNSLVSGRDIEYSADASNVAAGVHITLGSPADLLLDVPSRGKLGVDPRGGNRFDFEDGDYATTTPKANPDRNDSEYYQYKKIDVTNVTDDQITLEVIGTDEGEFILDIGVQTMGGEWRQVVINGNTSKDKVDVFVIDMTNGDVMSLDSDMTRERFIELVEEATVDLKSNKQRFFIKYAHRIFNAIDADRNKLAQLRLRIFEKLLKVKRVKDEPLNQGIDQLWSQLR